MQKNTTGFQTWAGMLFGRAIDSRPAPRSSPTVFHITHYKAGSQWIHRLFQALVPDRIVAPEASHHQFLDVPVVPGKVYPTLYLTRQKFESVALPKDHCKFVMIRDLRDTLISHYFSLLKSHDILQDWMQTTRTALSRMSKEEGLIMMMDGSIMRTSQIQWSWITSGEPVLKYEDLLRNDEAILEDLFLRKCRLKVDPNLFRQVVRANRFEVFAGRKPGVEDVNSHQRKGIAGDWRNHFTPRVAAEFKERYGSLLVATGYERDERW
ncbi:sulfotransferase : Sulfotransferase domain superfamily OS=Synechococcus sp. PCC 7335 GN=S7335_4812 PE=4 SV=1: Sulfotransfer_1 [Gemmataceae bacterium]|nr:sulfotransferase : Sulfotransferase domain superfamily OS=Synechococcus sp. PCC 7335 GN=S7335_4812 PE=4 SV=1: Sulfotransfer_1 [Gemmataceae bacterium]VTU00140.1 sulfotransferase : Sulfotransferase domain superfamily OS=Synechococcus sp. PCC 7335 GN=S7335_4812 PE=4 SV=1: Sulfotransfer_1 [Gemmataceae bacterium]